MFPAVSLGGRRPASISANCLAIEGRTKFDGCPGPVWLNDRAVMIPPPMHFRYCTRNSSAIALLAAYGLSGFTELVSVRIMREPAYTWDVLTFRILGSEGKLIAASKRLDAPNTFTSNVSLGLLQEISTSET